MCGSVMGVFSLVNVCEVLCCLDEFVWFGEVVLFFDNYDVLCFLQGSFFEDEGQVCIKYGLWVLFMLWGVLVFYQGIEIVMCGGVDFDNWCDMCFESQWMFVEKVVYNVVCDVIVVCKVSLFFSWGIQMLFFVFDWQVDDLLLLICEQGGQWVLVVWYNGLKCQSYLLKFSILGIKVNVQDVIKMLFVGQDVKVSVKGGYLYLSLLFKDVVVFVLW